LRDIVSGALETLALDDGNKKALADCGAIAPLTELLSCDSVVSQAHAAGTLQSLAVNGENQVLIAQAGTISALVQLSSEAQGVVLEKVMGALLNLAHHEDNKLAIMQAGVADAWFKLIADTTTVRAELVGKVLPMLHCLLVDPQSQLAAIEAGATSMLLGMLVDESDEVRQKASDLLFLLVNDSAQNQAAIADRVGIDTLIAMLASEGGALCETEVGQGQPP